MFTPSIDPASDASSAEADRAAELNRGAQAACRLARSDLLVLRGDHDLALELIGETLRILPGYGDEWTFANAWDRRASILQARGELDEALRIRREEERPVFERLGDVRSLLVGRTNLALTLLLRRRPEDMPEVRNLLAAALRDARRLGTPEAEQIADIVRQLGLNPDAPPFV